MDKGIVSTKNDGVVLNEFWISVSSSSVFSSFQHWEWRTSSKLKTSFCFQKKENIFYLYINYFDVPIMFLFSFKTGWNKYQRNLYIEVQIRQHYNAIQIFLIYNSW